jgi:hypothetical protein
MGPLSLLGALISLAELGIAQSEERNIGCVPKSRPLRRAQGVQLPCDGQHSQIVGFLKAQLHCTSCSPHPWGSPLRGPPKRSKNAPDVFVAWDCPRATSGLSNIPLALLGAFISLAELGIAQSEERKQLCVLKSRFRCTTLQVLHRQNHDK